MTANARQVRRMMGGDIPQSAVEGLEESLAELQEAVDAVQAGDVTVVDGGTP